MKDKLFLLAPLSTLALAGAFLAGGGAGSKTAYEAISGKAWSMRQPETAMTPTAPAVAVSSAGVVSAPVALPAPPRAARAAKTPARRHRREVARVLANAARPVSAEAHPSSASVAPSTAPAPAAPEAPSPAARPAASSTPPDYALEDIADRFENDESKFPLDRSTEAGGVALRLVGLEKLPKMYVLKLAVVNSTATDFFVKTFTVAAGGQILSSRPIFRILVEPQRTREGYVVFEKPLAGASVRVNLKEDGGKGRSLEMAIPYPF